MALTLVDLMDQLQDATDGEDVNIVVVTADGKEHEVQEVDGQGGGGSPCRVLVSPVPWR